MDQNVVSLHGVNHELHLSFGRSIVQILLYRREHADMDQPQALNAPCCIVPGIVIVSGHNFAHIIACANYLCSNTAAKYRFEIVFPDRTTIDLDMNAVERYQFLAAFYVPTPVGVVDAVQFSDQNASMNQKVQMFGFDYPSQSQLIGGFVTHVGGLYFGHDCGPSRMSYHGSPVFNMENRLVGISYSYCSVTYAMNVTAMTLSLSKMFNQQPLSKILEHINAVGEAKYQV